MGKSFIDFLAGRGGNIGLKSNVHGKSVLKQEVCSLIVQTCRNYANGSPVRLTSLLTGS